MAYETESNRSSTENHRNTRPKLEMIPKREIGKQTKKNVPELVIQSTARRSSGGRQEESREHSYD